LSQARAPSGSGRSAGTVKQRIVTLSIEGPAVMERPPGRAPEALRRWQGGAGSIPGRAGRPGPAADGTGGCAAPLSPGEVDAVTVGRRVWAIAEGFIPGRSVSDAHDLVSHEAFCVLNAGDEAAEITVTLFFTDRDPVGPYRMRVEPRRTQHFRFNDLTDPELVPRDTSYASLIESSAPIVVQHTRLDSRDPHIALLSTIAFSEA
jgi:hypothetical protein